MIGGGPVLAWLGNSLTNVLSVALLVAWAGGMLLLAALGLGVVRETFRRRDHDTMDGGTAGSALAQRAEPPAAMSPAMATVILRRRPSRRSVSVALVELAGHQLIRFEEAPRLARHAAGLRVLREDVRPHHGLARPEMELFEGVKRAGRHEGGAIGPEDLQLLDPTFQRFQKDLEASAVAHGWLKSEWHTIRDTWYLVATVEFVLGAMGLTIGLLAPSLLVLITGPTWLIAAAATMVVVYTMPARTSRGMAVVSWLQGHAAELAVELAQARSMRDVATHPALTRNGSPDEALAWALAFSLDAEVRGVLARSISDIADGTVRDVWLPGWWTDAPAIHRRSRRFNPRQNSRPAPFQRFRHRLGDLSLRLDYRLSRSPVSDLVRDLDPRRASPSALAPRRPDPS